MSQIWWDIDLKTHKVRWTPNRTNSKETISRHTFDYWNWWVYREDSQSVILTQQFEYLDFLPETKEAIWLENLKGWE